MNRSIFTAEKPRKNVNIGLDTENFDIEEAYSYSMNNKDKRQVKKIIFEYFELIEEEWNKFQRERNK